MRCHIVEHSLFLRPVPNAGVPGNEQSNDSGVPSDESSKQAISSGSDSPYPELPMDCGCGKCNINSFLSNPSGCPNPNPNKGVPVLKDSYEYQRRLDDVEEEESLNMKTMTINDVFSIFQRKICQSFKNRNITAKDVIQYLMTKPSNYRSSKVYTAQEYYILDYCTDHLQQKQNLDELFFEFLPNFWSWYDPTLLEDLIKRFGDDTDKDKLEVYLGELAEYFGSRKIERPEDVVFKSVSRFGRKVLLLKIDQEWEAVPMRQVNRIRTKVADILGLDKSALFLCSVRRGCLLFKFLVPPHVVFPIPSHQRKALKAEGVMMIKCKRTYYYKLSCSHKSKVRNTTTQLYN